MARKKAELDLQGLEKPMVKKSKFVFDPNNDPFILRNAKQVMEFAKELRVPNMLLGELIYEGTVIMLFSETGLGKSLLAYQFADAVSRGKSILGLKNQTKPQNVIIFDFENGELVFRKRYCEVITLEDGTEKWFNDFPFNYEKFDLCFLNDPNKYEVPKVDAIEWWFELIKYKAEMTNSKIIIIDNLFALISQGGIESTKEVAPVLRELHNLKNSKGWTVIVVHHTPKRANTTLTRNDLAGSSNLSNLVDGVIGIGKSYFDGDQNSRYIKQIKPTRYSACVYGENNVITCKTSKILPNFTGFYRIELDESNSEYKYESMHLAPYNNKTGTLYTEEEKDRNINKMKELMNANPKASKQEIADYLGVSRQTIYNYLNKETDNGELFDNYGL